MNLLQHPWLSVRKQSGEIIRACPSAIADPEIVDLAMPRADFQGAAYQWLIGLLQTAVSPESEADWLDWYEDPPAETRLAQAFSAFEPAFDLDGDGPCFMQDLDPLEEVKTSPVSGLLIEAPGNNGIKNNTDFFVKRGIAEQLCPNCAALALYTMQANGPAGGAGFRTGMRGGGPLTTLILPDEAASSLWRKLWLNAVPAGKLVQPGQAFSPPKADDATIFPWLAATPTSEKKGSEQRPDRWHPLHPYWSMPRRFRLLFEHATERCDVCGDEAEIMVSEVRAKNYGINYDGPWVHPLTPYRSDPQKPDTPPWSQKGRPGGIDYRHWSALVFADHDSLGADPAVVVRDYMQTKYPFCRDEVADGYSDAVLSAHARLWISGFDLDNMKARGWVDAQMPLLTVSIERQDIFREWVAEFVALSQATAREVSDRIRHAWFKDPKQASGDTSYLINAFYAATQAEFFAAMRQLRDVVDQAEDLNHKPVDVARRWYENLRSAAYDLFDEQTLTGSGDLRQLERSVRQRRWLSIWLAGGGKNSKKQNAVKNFALNGGFEPGARREEQTEETSHV